MTQAFNCCGANLANTLVSIVLNFLVLPQHLWACKCPVTLLTLVPERILQLHVCGLQSSPPLLLLTCGDGTRTISYWGSIPIIVVVFPDYLNLDA